LQWDKFLAERPAVVGSQGEFGRRIHLAVTDALLAILDSRFKKLRLLQLEEEFRDLKSQLKLAARVAKASKVINQLLAGVTEENPNRYREAYEHLLELKSKQADHRPAPHPAGKARNRAAPAWAGAIRIALAVHGRGEPPRDVASAWTWRQLNDELDRRSSIVSLEALQTKSEKRCASSYASRTTVELIDNRSWVRKHGVPLRGSGRRSVGWLDNHPPHRQRSWAIRVSLLRTEAARK